MRLKQLLNLIKEDFKSYKINKQTKLALLTFYFKTPGFKVIVWMRICKYLSITKNKLFYIFARFKYKRLQIKYGIQIDYRLDIDGGFNIHHYGGIVINKDCKIGKNFNVRHNTTLGNTEKGVPKIGNNVYVGANSVIIGDVSIGDNCIIDAGSVVTKSFESDCVIAGNPAKLIKKIEKSGADFGG